MPVHKGRWWSEEDWAMRGGGSASSVGVATATTPVDALESFDGKIWASPAPAPPPLVSIITPFRNMAKRGLEQCIHSVRQQTLQDWEWFLVDDGSTDGGDRVVEYYATLDPRIKLRRQTAGSGGPAAPRNAAMWLARGEFVAFLDADDWWEPDKLDQQVGRFILDPALGFQYSARERLGVLGLNYAGIDTQQKSNFDRNEIPNSSVMLRKSLLHAVGGQDITVAPGVEDWDLWIRCLAVSKSYCNSTPLVHLGVHPEAITQKMEAEDRWPVVVAPVAERARRIVGALKRMHERNTRVLFLAPWAIRRGSELFVLWLLQHLAGLGVETRVLLDELRGELLPDYEHLARVHQISSDYREHIEWADVVHYQSHGWKPQFDLHEIPAEKLLYTQHSALASWPHSFGRRVSVWSSRRPGVEDALAPEFRPPCIEIPNAVEVPVEQSSSCKSLILGISPAERYKGFDLFLRAAEELHERRSDLQFVIVGLDPYHDAYEFALQEVARLEVAGLDIRYLPSQPREVICQLMQEAAVFLQLTRSEASSLALLEAQVIGTPVVVSAAGGSAQGLYRGEIVSPGAIEAAVEATLRLIGSCVPKEVRQQVSWRHDTLRTAAAYAEVYRWTRLQQELATR